MSALLLLFSLVGPNYANADAYARITSEANIVPKGWKLMEYWSGSTSADGSMTPGLKAEWELQKGNGKIRLTLYTTGSRNELDKTITLRKQSRQAIILDLEKSKGHPNNLGEIYRYSKSGNTAAVSLVEGTIDDATVTAAKKLAEQARDLGQSYLDGKRIKGSSVYSQGLDVRSFDPTLQLRNVSMIRLSDRAYRGPKFQPQVPISKARYAWTYVSKTPDKYGYPMLVATLDLFDNETSAVNYVKLAPLREFPQVGTGFNITYINAKTGKKLPDKPKPSIGPFISVPGRWGYVDHSGSRAAFLQYTFGESKSSADSAKMAAEAKSLLQLKIKS